MRLLVECAYDGTNYVGWQVQPNGVSVQQVIQEGLSTILREEIEVVGCGRTDAGVHASQYYFHFDTGSTIPENLVDRINRFLPPDIAFKSIAPVDDDFHARFSATRRGYHYYMHFRKDPFQRVRSLYVHRGDELDWDLITRAAQILMEYEEFKPFCKTGSDTPHYKCSALNIEWTLEEETAIMSIRANRFLRGMVRLITGALLRIGKEEISLDQLKKAMDSQTPLQRADSAPGHALFLSHVQYPE